MRIRAAYTPLSLLALAVLNLATPTSAAAAAAKLTGGTVTPTTGTTATAFQFSVHFVGTATDEAITVSASVAGQTVALALTGTPRNGTWTGSSTLPVGSWPVTFSAVSSGGTNPTFGPTAPVIVTAPTPPTPVPTPVPTARPTPRPTPLPATATPQPANSVSPGVSPSPFGTTVANPSGSPAETAISSRNPSGSPSPSPSPAAVPGSRPFSVPIEGVVAIGLLGAVTVAAALGERRRRLAVEAFRAEERSPEGAAPTGDPGNGWEHDVVDDETVATIDYEAPDGHGDPPTG